MELRRRVAAIVAIAALTVLMAVSAWRAPERWGPVDLRPSLEDRADDGALYTPATQSFLRGHHWLESAHELEITTYGTQATLGIAAPGSDDFLRVVGLPLDQLVPRLHYTPSAPPDAFDAFNLMLAEYSRNSLSVPNGSPGDEMAHFESSFEEAVPWTLRGDFEFEPNPRALPVRVAVTNNCLGPGLWELSATDRAGEIHHAWFELPRELYWRLMARANGIDPSFAEHATRYDLSEVALDLDRLRTPLAELGTTGASLLTGGQTGYSTQDSRRKLSGGFVLVEVDGALQRPVNRDDLTAGPIQMSEFEEPGRYSYRTRRTFDLGFLRDVRGATVRRVSPHTDYGAAHRDPPERTEDYVEVVVDLGELALVLSNLPLELLVLQEDLRIEGFGVGVLSSSGLAERRAFLLEEGPAPSVAYLARRDGDRLVGINSHERGLEQVFIRTHARASPPWWEITVTSYERIVDLVKYRVEIPDALHAETAAHSRQYVSPLYRTYRDDNLR